MQCLMFISGKISVMKPTISKATGMMFFLIPVRTTETHLTTAKKKLWL